MRRPQDYILLYFKGISMGVAEVIPGVSGSTIAFISHVYEELVHSLSSFNAENFKLLTSFRIGDFWKKINGVFLLVLSAGFITSSIFLAKVLAYFLAEYPIHVWSFFFGLIFLSSLLFLRNIKKWTSGAVITFLLGALISYMLTLLAPVHTADNLLFIFLAGALAACAVFLPGISGIFVLLLLGKYEYFVAAITEPNILPLLFFISGCALSMIYFSRLLSYVLQRYNTLTLTMLAGFMVGSLNKAWPWKEFIFYRIDANGKQLPAIFRSILPGDYIEKTGKNPDVIQAILFLALGVFIVVLIEKIVTRLKTKN